MIHPDIEQVLYTEEQLHSRVREVGEQIAADYAGREPMLISVLRARKPASIRICALMDKPDRRTKPITADYVGFTIPDAFIVGYGLDYAEKYRNLPYVGVLKPSVYSE